MAQETSDDFVMEGDQGEGGSDAADPGTPQARWAVAASLTPSDTELRWFVCTYPDVHFVMETIKLVIYSASDPDPAWAIKTTQFRQKGAFCTHFEGGPKAAELSIIFGFAILSKR
jgi:hypothetical protein